MLRKGRLGYLNRVVLALFIVTMSLVAVQRLIVADTQIDWDEELYFEIGRFWEQGVIPYRDIFDHKPPMIYVFYMMLSWGGRMFSVRSAVAALLLVSCFLMFRELKRVTQAGGEQPNWPLFLFLTAVLCSLMSHGTASGTNTELVYVPLLVLSLWLLLSDRPVPAAICAALALEVKYTVLADVIGVGMVYYLVTKESRERTRSLLTWSLLVALIALGMYGMFYAYFRTRGIDLIQEIVVRNIMHASQSEASILDPAGGFVRFMEIAVVVSVCVLLPTGLEVVHKRLLVGASIWFALSLLQGCVTRQYYLHYFIPAFVPLTLIWGSMKVDYRWVVPLFIVLVGVECVEVSGSYHWLNDYRAATQRYRPFCGAIDDGGYVLTSFLAAYRICNAPTVDKFVFPAFYLQDHFAQVSGSGGLEALRSKTEQGKVASIITTRALLEDLGPRLQVPNSELKIVPDTAWPHQILRAVLLRESESPSSRAQFSANTWQAFRAPTLTTNLLP